MSQKLATKVKTGTPNALSRGIAGGSEASAGMFSATRPGWAGEAMAFSASDLRASPPCARAPRSGPYRRRVPSGRGVHGRPSTEKLRERERGWLLREVVLAG
jgi:hypothetical protein